MKLSSMWSFNDKLGRKLIARWSFKKDRDGTWIRSKCYKKENGCIQEKPEMA